VYCDSIIESNRRSANLSISPLNLVSGLVSPADKEVNTPTTPSGLKLNQWTTATVTAAMSDLHSFFPFDPYRLPQSSKWFEGIYRDWSMVAFEDDDDDDDVDSDSEGQAAEDQDSEEEDGIKDRADDEEETDAEEEGEYGVPMELGSVRKNRHLQDNLNVEESFGKMSISPVQTGVHHHMNGRARG
jgi:RNA polymerase I-specific transcription initiation factor RRN3